MKTYLEYWPTIKNGTHVVEITRDPSGATLSIKQVGILWI
jgi:hypothetical protein